MQVITRSIWFKNVDSAPSGSFKGLSMAISTVDKMITKMMKGSKYGCYTMFLIKILKRFFGPKMKRAFPMSFTSMF